MTTPLTGVTRTERGLSIAGTRITLYQLMDYLHAGHSLQTIRQHFPQITAAQFETALSYLEANRAEVEAEYQTVVEADEAARQNWEAQRERFAEIAKSPPSGREAAWAKLQVEKARLDPQA